MGKMSKTEAKRKLQEAVKKFQKVYLAQGGAFGAVKIADLDAVEKIAIKCMNRIK